MAPPGVLTAMVPGSTVLVTAVTLIATTPFRLLHAKAGDAQVARLMVPVAAVYFMLRGGKTIVAPPLIGYAFVTQLFPSLLCSLLPRNPVTA